MVAQAIESLFIPVLPSLLLPIERSIPENVHPAVGFFFRPSEVFAQSYPAGELQRIVKVRKASALRLKRRLQGLPSVFVIWKGQNVPTRKAMKQETTGAMVQRDVQRGLSGDKKPGFDPAMVPMETDAEAGSVATPPDALAEDRRAQRHPDPSDYQGMKASAMRPFSDEPRQRMSVIGVLVLLVVLILVLGGAAALFTIGFFTP